MEIFNFKRKKDEVLQHSILVAPGFAYPPQEFYDAIVRELAAHKVPGLDISRVEYAEGGVLSDKRIYLRMIRERLAFDACAAPFGTDYFFSCRTVYSPVVVKLWHMVAVLALLLLVFSLLAKPLGASFALIAVLGLVLTIAQVFRNTIALGLSDLDAALLKIPVISPIYERWFRKDTYYRQDTRLVYLEIVPHLIQKLIDDITAEKGVKLVRQYQRGPILGELYKPVAVRDEPK
ncbi:MAG TPA: hypothetical protein VMV72_04885 [Verrucomicrobiae bacterium]|nr:hypothetical protein [Verrucomicrobiae bacterium]